MPAPSEAVSVGLEPQAASDVSPWLPDEASNGRTHLKSVSELPDRMSRWLPEAWKEADSGAGDREAPGHPRVGPGEHDASSKASRWLPDDLP